MVESSKGERTGRIVSIDQKRILLLGNMKIPFVSIKIHSSIEIGFGATSEEDASVLLLGDICVDKWFALSPPPKVGDMLRVNNAIMYVKNSELCFRVYDPSCVEIMSQEEAKLVSSLSATPSLAAINEVVDAKEFFRFAFAERKEQEKEKE